MANYFSIFFKSKFANSPTLKTWLVDRGDKIVRGQDLFLYGEGVQQKKFQSSIDGIIKIILIEEGQNLSPNCELAVLIVEENDAKESLQKGDGQFIEPDELKRLAEAASIRLPPESTEFF